MRGLLIYAAYPLDFAAPRRIPRGAHYTESRRDKPLYAAKRTKNPFCARRNGQKDCFKC
jgi:hypothetical protein